MTWFIVLVFLMTISTALVLFALLPGNISFSGGGGDDGSNIKVINSNSTGDPDKPSCQLQPGDDKYHFNSFGSILLQLFSITMGVDYDSFNAVAARPGRPLAKGQAADDATSPCTRLWPLWSCVSHHCWPAWHMPCASVVLA
jgi:hypothetical protein